MSTGPSQAEIDLYGTVVARSVYANVTLTFMDVGIQLFMCLYGLSTFLETPKSLRKGRVPFVAISFIIWATSSFTAILDSYVNFQTLFDAGPTGSDYVVQWRRYNANSNWFQYAISTSLLVYIAIGDCLMLYRCFVLWRDRLWVMVLPVLTFLASVALGILNVYPWSRFISRVPTSAWTLVSVAMNIMVTVLIVVRLTRARRDIERAMPGNDTRVYSGIIAIVIESATPVTVFGILFSLMVLLMYRWETLYHQVTVAYAFETVFAMLYYSFCALSPQMIIFRVTTGRSWTTTYDREKAAAAFSRPLEFRHTTTDHTGLYLHGEQTSGPNEGQLEV
ncbi:hypothetical protein CC1G_03161 [Coprinopsis cinerea okayama7|uniref:Uncharacterized protein n=1 Tax=Coprinopsis cinerea (strain Okayama-7 / 130 / ATCC MYA-4618 / FGSC 9003) TaxID=240176 RepID=A8PF55_COPC7|nr:hypothetical protein CC1G_03161 [Coprinopsis cinerea okayama7\|eukprot:XP_001840932.2 hypothetical protein CC1G_03161 [Coprinopsis cinerea okayama7\